MTAVASPPAPGQGPDPSPVAAGPPPGPGDDEIPETTEGWRPVALDVLGLGAMTMLAVTGFGPAFGGTRHLVVGAAATLLGAGLAVLLRRRTLWLLVAALVVTEVVVGALLVRPDAVLAPVAPTPQVARTMVSGAFRGWVNLLTTTIPVGGAQALLVVPWAATLVAAAVAVSTSVRAGRRPWALLAVLAPAALLVGGLVVGSDAPAWGPQASAFVVAALLWGAARQRRIRGAGVSRGRRPRVLSGAALLAVALLAGLAVGRSDVVTGGDRLVVRDHVEPPVDLRELASPLAGFRGHRTAGRRDAVLFTVSGLEAGDRIRLATLDHYDGRVWHVQAGPDDESSGFFRRVGQRIPVDVEGERREVSVEVGDYEGVWLPTVGATTGVVFSGERATELSEDLRYNLATGTAAVPDTVEPGDRYRLDAVVPAEHRDLRDGQPDPTVTVPEVTVIPEVRTRALELGGPPGESPLARARTIEEWFQSEGADDDAGRAFFSDGFQDERTDPPPSLPGHGTARIRELLDEAGAVVGNEEQFASAMALMARVLGLPSRVVMGFAPELDEDGTATVTGASVDAWTEVAVAGVGWIPLDPTPVDRKEPAQETRNPQPPPELYVPPPPVRVPRVDVPSGSGSGATCEDCEEDAGGGGLLPAWVGTAARIVGPPVLLVAGGTALLAGTKAWRRRRRRRRGTPEARAHGAWAEVCDLARDMGDVVPDRATRREVAVTLDRPGVGAFARSTDALLFGPGGVDDASAAHLWTEAEVLRSAMTGSLSLLGRWKALVNPTSLRRRGGRPTGGRRPRRRGAVAPAPGQA